MAKWIITVEMGCSYEFDCDKFTEEEAVDKAWDYFTECKPYITVDREEEEE